MAVLQSREIPWGREKATGIHIRQVTVLTRS